MIKKLFFTLYIIVLLGLSFFSYLFIDPNLIYLKNLYSGFIFSNRGETTILYSLIIILLFIFYFLFLWLLNKKKINIKDVKFLVMVTTVLLLISYPAMLSFDIFNYIATSKVLFFYHENPYTVMPIEFVGDPLLTFTHAANKIALYGPSWILLTAIPYFLGFGNFLITLFSFKLFISLFYLGTVYLIWKISKSLLSVYFFAFNPLVVIETLVGGHNDIVMIFFALLSFYIMMKKKSVIPATIFFMLSIFIKYSTIFLLPVFVYIVWKTKQKNSINWSKIFYFSSIIMIFAFLLSPIREEIYPWYAIWFLPFVSFVFNKRILIYISLALSFGLLLRYLPFMFLGTHFGITPFLKSAVTFIPVFFVLIYIIFKNKIWLKIFSRL